MVFTWRQPSLFRLWSRKKTSLRNQMWWRFKDSKMALRKRKLDYGCWLGKHRCTLTKNTVLQIICNQHYCSGKEYLDTYSLLIPSPINVICSPMLSVINWVQSMTLFIIVFIFFQVLWLILEHVDVQFLCLGWLWIDLKYWTEWTKKLF